MKYIKLSITFTLQLSAFSLHRRKEYIFILAMLIEMIVKKNWNTTLKYGGKKILFFSM